MSTNISFSSKNLDECLRLLAKDLKRRSHGKMFTEIILVGGASIIANYGFRDTTYDVDALMQADSLLKETINYVGDLMGFPNKWLNSDFKMTKSYSPYLRQCSSYYKTFSNTLTVRTITREYLVAMKLMSFRQYKNDISDIIGILKEQSDINDPITYTEIKKAFVILYNDWENLPHDAKLILDQIFKQGNLEKLYQYYRDNELKSKNMLLSFNENYPKAIKEDNIDNIITYLKAKKKEKI